MIVTTND
jgi:hypothetical protein